MQGYIGIYGNMPEDGRIYGLCIDRNMEEYAGIYKNIDPAWDGWRKHVKDYMTVPEVEQTMWDTWEPQVLERLIRRHAKVKR